MPHNSDLSRRPGRSNAGSIKSGRLNKQWISAMQYYNQNSLLPSSCQYINTIQTFSTIHLCKHLIHNTICDTSAVMSSISCTLCQLVSLCYITYTCCFVPSWCDWIKFVEEQNTRLGCLGSFKQIAYWLFACTNVLVENFWTFHADKVKSTFFGDSWC